MNKKRMKGIAVVMAVFLLPTTACTQDMETFDTGLFSFEYPANFITVPIQDSPHMLLKLLSEETYFSISAWDYGLDESMSAWDEEVYDVYNGSSMQGDFVSIDKVLVKTRDEKIKALKVKSNGSQGFKVLSYILINDGYLYVISYVSEGAYATFSSTAYEDKMLSGLSFKSSANKSVSRDDREAAAVRQTYIDFCAELNQQLPLKIDELTTFKSAIFANWEITFNYTIDLDLSILTDSELKEIMIETKKEQQDYAKMLLKQAFSDSRDDIVQVMKEYGLKLRMFYTDATGRVIGTIEYTYKDFE